MATPKRPKLYHIVHVDRLPAILADGCLWSDAVMSRRSGSGTTIGMSQIKQRRLVVPVSRHGGDCVGDYVPFYFCPRSIMLYVISRANNPELAYRGGQDPIIHLEADLHQVVAWADASARRWAFSTSNAATIYTRFYTGLENLDQINWVAVEATDFRSTDVKERKQAEFLVYRSFPWELVDKIGVRTRETAQHVEQALVGTRHRPELAVRTEWYF
ncbi:DUF4433 domain-containing protein [Frankia sp. Cr2]|uniref:type II toxin-antitoxin system toxin DNA ADP-ribosyl transferase DarT n=1 Tax=Frankia sp. Cr2 TaxID=3073932 RepID=UPI002AD59838|nr:DUF4433 domain-containing protein [Frankia sp. Cr2]